MEDALLTQFLTNGLAHCRVVATQHGGLLTSLFLAGLIGSASHCVGMCGPFVLAQTVARLEAVPVAQMREWHRLTGAALIPYHAGRMTTYVLLGALASAFLGQVQVFSGLHWLSAALLAIAAVLFAGYALQRLWPALLPRRARPPVVGDGKASPLLGRRLNRLVQPLFARPIGWRGYGLGVVLGFLPCGLLWAALAAASAAGDPLTGALAMAAFTAGTLPALLMVALAGHVAGDRFRSAAYRLAPILMLVNAAALSYLAVRSVA